MQIYTFRTTIYHETKAENAIQALQKLHDTGIFPDEFRNDSKYDDDWHSVDWVSED